MNKVFSYFSGIKREMGKVSWSSKQELVGSTAIVFVFAILVGLFLWILDEKILSDYVATWIYGVDKR